MKLVEKNEGTRKELVNGTLEELVTWLVNNPDEYNWQLDEDPNAVMPDLSNIETVNDLQIELDKVDLSWWTLVIE
ncbi:hypothetical protein HNQ56_003720 [Anaerotaenia torta]|uniref:hypothetical protein n=1 Tax=Anaerotaenia torta TaxID=433293 RepID=UPI003D1BAAA3